MDDDEFEFDEVSAQGNLARISGFSADGSLMFLRMRHGAWVWASSEDRHFEGDVGDAVLVAGNSYRVVPEKLWKEDTFIGVVRLKQHDAIAARARARAALSRSDRWTHDPHTAAVTP